MYDEEFESFEEGPSGGDRLSPEEEEALGRAVEITKEVLSSPRKARPDLVFYAIESWGPLTSLGEDHVSDVVGEVTELLEEVLKRKHITYEEARHGKLLVENLARFYGISTWRDSIA